MRFLFISTLYPNSLQPTRATYSRSLVLALRELGHDVRVIAPVPWCPVIDRYARGRVPPPKHETLDGIDVLHTRFRNIPGLFTWRNHLAYRSAVAPVLRQTLRDFQPDHVSIGFAYPDGAAMIPLLNKISGADSPWPYDRRLESNKAKQPNACHLSAFSLQPFTYSLQVLGSDFRQRIRQSRFKELVLETLRAAPLIFCPGKALKRDMTAAGIEAANIVPFNNGVDHNVFHPETHRPTDTISVLFVGNLVQVKGVDRLLRAWAKLTAGRASSLQPGWLEARPALTIIGTGPLEASLKKLCRRLNIESSVQFMGRKSHHEIADHMRQAHCLCLPSHSEGMPNVVLESIACGTPVVATAVGEVPYLIKDGKNGYLVADEMHPARRTRKKKRENETVLVEQLSSALQRALRRSWESTCVSDTLSDMTWRAAAETVIGAVKEFAAK